jgi:hypothetical protein
MLRQIPAEGTHQRAATSKPQPTDEDGAFVTWKLGPVLALMALAACGGPGASPQVPADSARPRSAAVTDCGTFRLSQGDSLPTSAVQCLVEAVHARHPAELRATSPSVEGDPIPVTYIAGTDGRVEVITDFRQDNFSSKIRTRMTCAEPTLTPDRPTVTFALCSEPTPIPD